MVILIYQIKTEACLQVERLMSLISDTYYNLIDIGSNPVAHLKYFPLNKKLLYNYAMAKA